MKYLQLKGGFVTLVGEKYTNFVRGVSNIICNHSPFLDYSPDLPGIRAVITDNALRQVYKPGLANMDIPVSINALAIIHAENYD